MLLKIREKAQGVFAWIILVAICVPFALWGIQNYVDVGKEIPEVTVGDKEFFQRDITRAYQQYSQQLAGKGIPEEIVKEQSVQKLINDEVLLQHVQDLKLAVTDQTAREYIKNLQYFQKDGKFSKQQYQSLLTAQNMSSEQFVQQIRNAIKMEQFQRGIMESGFVTDYDIEKFYALQNQVRNIKYLTIGIENLTEIPTEEDIINFYQQNQDKFQVEAQVAIEYIELALVKLAAEVDATEEQLEAFYEEQKEFYTSKERRRISHILFSLKESDEEKALEQAKLARQRLETEEFATVAKELSDDSLTSKTGGDLGLFNVGTMEPAFEEAASQLKLGEISAPVKSAFGYHIIKVTELEPEKTKTFNEVKADITDAYKKAQAESVFYELGETLTEVSFENSDNLSVASDAVGVPIQKTELFTSQNGLGVAAEAAVRELAFSEEVLNGNNSEPIELPDNRVIVLRMIEHKPATTKELKTVREEIVKAILDEKAKAKALTTAEAIKKRLNSGETLEKVAGDYSLQIEAVPELARNNTEVPWEVKQAAFKLAKPKTTENPSIAIAEKPSGEQMIVALFGVSEGKPNAEDAKQQELAKTHLANAFGRTDYAAAIKSLEENADIRKKE